MPPATRTNQAADQAQAHARASQPRRADAKRNVAAILAAAAECLARNPDTSMGEIAAAAGVGRMTLYGHFKTRAELLNAVEYLLVGLVDALGGQLALSRLKDEAQPVDDEPVRRDEAGERVARVAGDVDRVQGVVRLGDHPGEYRVQ